MAQQQQPKRLKHRKHQKGRNKGSATRGHRIWMGDFAIKMLEPTLMSSAVIEAVRVALSRGMERKGQLWLRVFPSKPMTKKPAEVRMGKGKGNPEYYVAPIKPGTILFELAGVPFEIAKKAIQLAGHKIGVKSKMVTRPGYFDLSQVSQEEQTA